MCKQENKIVKINFKNRTFLDKYLRLLFNCVLNKTLKFLTKKLKEAVLNLNFYSRTKWN